MARKQDAVREPRENVSEILSVPLTPRLMTEVHELAGREERRPGEMGRILIKEAINARKAK